MAGRKTSKPDIPRQPCPLMEPGAWSDGGAQAIWHAVQPLDLIAREMEARWGVDRLPALVSPETAARFGSALAKLNAAIQSGDAKEAVRRVEVMMRGWRALDAEATAAGAQPAPADCWPLRIGNEQRPAWIAKDPAAARAVRQLKGEADVYTLEEVGRLLGSVLRPDGLLREAKRAFPEGRVVAVRDKAAPADDGDGMSDEIPF